MTNNDVFRRLRYAMNINNQAVIEIFRLTGHEISQSEISALFKKEGEEGFLECSDEVLESFLDGLIALKRGKRGEESKKAKSRSAHLTNNDILKKLRIALELKEEEMLAVFRLANFTTSKAELSALFRNKGHENYKQCGDQLLRNFLKGLTIKNRDQSEERKDPAAAAPAFAPDSQEKPATS